MKILKSIGLYFVYPFLTFILGILTHIGYLNYFYPNKYTLQEPPYVEEEFITQESASISSGITSCDTIYILTEYNITDNSKSTNLFELLDEILDNNEVFYIKQLAINGSFLKKLGYSGKDIGITLEKILFFVMEYNDCNNIDDICDFLKN